MIELIQFFWAIGQAAFNSVAGLWTMGGATLGLAVMGYSWSTKTDNVTAHAAAHVNLLQTEKVDRDGAIPFTGAVTGTDLTLSGVATIANAGLHLLDTNASHDLIITPGSDLTADRILSIVTGDAARTITLSGNPTLADWFDQAVKAASGPTFDHLHITHNISGETATLTQLAASNPLAAYCYSATAGHFPSCEFYKSHSDTAATVATVTTDDLGMIRFYGVNSSPAFAFGAFIRAIQNGAAGATYVPTDLRFTVCDGSNAYGAMSITTSGGVHVGGTSDITNDNIYIDGNCSALTFTDRTPYPKDKAEAWGALKSIKIKADKSGIDHAALHPFVRAEQTIGAEKDESGEVIVPAHVEVGRNVGATLSAAVEALKDLADRVSTLEKK